MLRIFKKNSSPIILIVIFLAVSSMKSVKTTETLPVLLFKVNSTAFDTTQDYLNENKGMDSTTIIMNVLKVIKSDPNIKMTIEGFYDPTETMKDLGIKRAEKIKNILIRDGINDSIMKIKVRRGDYEGYTKREINAMSKADREFIRRRNRKVEFIIERW